MGISAGGTAYSETAGALPSLAAQAVIPGADAFPLLVRARATKP